MMSVVYGGQNGLIFLQRPMDAPNSFENQNALLAVARSESFSVQNYARVLGSARSVTPS